MFRLKVYDNDENYVQYLALDLDCDTVDELDEIRSILLEQGHDRGLIIPLKVGGLPTLDEYRVMFHDDKLTHCPANLWYSGMEFWDFFNLYYPFRIRCLRLEWFRALPAPADATNG